MNGTKGYCSIIQYCPELGRAEAANVGVLLFCPNIGFLTAITSRSNRRISRFFGGEGHDWKRINLFKRGFQERLAKEAGGIKTIDDLQQFIALRAIAMQITKPHPMKVTDPDRELRNLFEELIGEPVRKGRVVSSNTFIGETFKAF